MTVRYCGAGGNDGNTGLSWAQRKLTLNGVEDTPVVAGDTVYVGPGTYREMLTCDVSGAAGQTIEYRGDYTGANTDGVGGVVRITGSDNDQTATRATCITATSKDYRTFKYFAMDTTTASPVNNVTSTNLIIDGCYVTNGNTNSPSITMTNSAGVTDLAATIKNSIMVGGAFGIVFGATNAATSTNLIQNCVVLSNIYVGVNGFGIQCNRTGGVTIKNCLVMGSYNGIGVGIALPGGYTAVTVNNCIITFCRNGILATVAGEVVEDYNNLYGNALDRNNVAVGAHSLTYPPLFDVRWFFEMINGGRLATPFDLASYSQLLNVAGASPTTTDARGTTVQGAEREWGSLEYDSTLLIEGGGVAGGGTVNPLRGKLG